ncbi:MAG TPA: OmpA family protein [Candidatus Binatia bacterium]|jgi:OOP family OmpA-OmpF porin
MKRSMVTVLAFVICLSLTAKSGFAAPDEYDESQAHPLRITAYLIHPFAVITEWLFLRPFHYVVSANEGNEYLFGHRTHPPLLAEPQPLYDYGMAKRVPLKQAQSQPKKVAEIPAGEMVRVVEVPVEKVVTQEVPQVVEVERVIFPGVAFQFDSAELTELGKGQVYLAAQRYKDNNDVTIVVEGHTDNVGTDDYNQKLGMRRADAIMKELTRLGIDAGKMSTASFGESKPLVSDNSPWAHAVNRRVEFQVKAAQ